MAKKNQKVFAVSATLCAAAAFGVAKMYWSGPSGATAAGFHAGGLAAEHHGAGGNGGNGAGGNAGPYKHRVTVEPYTGADTAATEPATQPAVAPATGPSTEPTTTPVANPAMPPATEPTTGPTIGLITVPATEPTTGPASQPTTDATAQPDDQPKTFWTLDRMTGDWGGLRTKMEDRGITIDGNLTLVAGKTFLGGISTAGNAESYKLSIGVTADLEKLANIKGGSAYLNFRAMDGKKNSLDGAYQVTSQEYLPRRYQVSELWYQQNLFDGKVRIKAGKIDANTEFAFVSNAGEFVNSSMSFSPTILAMPTDPDPSTGIVGFVYPNEHLYAGVGMFDGSLADGIATGDRGPATLFEHSLFLIGEVGAKWTTAAHQDGRLGVGVWGQTGHLARFDGGEDHGTSGFYVVADQLIWRSHPEIDGDGRGVAGYFQYGYADTDVSPVGHHVGGGLTETGLVADRASDIAGMGVSWIDFTHASGSGFDGTGELDVEAFYKMAFTPWLSVKPDLQFLHNPGGVAGRSDTVAGSVQASVTF